jgi:hypothetical protein
MKRKIAKLAAAASCSALLASCEVVGDTPLTGTVSIYGDDWSSSIIIGEISSRSVSAKNPINFNSGK